jgi:hypothetical protein
LEVLEFSSVPKLSNFKNIFIILNHDVRWFGQESNLGTFDIQGLSNIVAP